MLLKRHCKQTLALLAGLTLATSAFADKEEEKGPSWLDDEQAVELIQAGNNWSELRLFNPNERERGPGHVVYVVTAAGVDDLPVSEDQKAELREDFGLDTGNGGPSTEDESSQEFIMIHKELLEGIELGRIPEAYEVYSDSTESCFGWSDKSKSKDWSFDEWSQQQNFSLGGGLTGSYAVNIPLSGQANLKLDYRQKKAFCVPYKFRFKQVRAWGNVTVAGDSDLLASLSLNYQWQQEWQLMNPRLGRISFSVGPIPVWIDFHLPTYAGLSLDATLTGSVGFDADFGAEGSFDYTCNSDTCSGSHTFQDSFESDALTGSLELEVEAQVYARLMVRAELYDDDLFYAEVGAKGFVEADLWGYYGNACGDADGDGDNETVEALTADAEAGYDWIYGIGGIIVSDRQWTSTGGRYPLGFWDLLGEGGSTALSPMVSGPDSVIEDQPVTYEVKMRPCFPFSDRVNLAIDPGGFQGNRFITAPQSSDPTQNSTELTRSFPNPRTHNIVVTATTDGDGRSFQASTERTLEVLLDVIAPEITSHPYSLVRNEGEPAAFGVTATGTQPTYRWYRDGVPLQNGGGYSGVTAPVLSISGVNPGHAGQYTVAVWNSAGSVTSQPASLTVVPVVVDEPDVRVTRHYDGVEIPNGYSYTYNPTPITVPTSVAFDICNDGNVALNIVDSENLVGPIPFRQIVTPPASLAPGECGVVRARFHTVNAGTYSGEIRIETNDPDAGESPFVIHLHGTATE